MFESCLEKQQLIMAQFSKLSKEAKYEKLIELGKQQSHLDPLHKIDENLVRGCQSRLYLHSYFLNGTVRFEAESDALISSGLAMILINVYSDETPEVILKCPPTYLEDLGIGVSLTPNRANGLYSIHLRMKQDAIRFLTEQIKSANHLDR